VAIAIGLALVAVSVWLWHKLPTNARTMRMTVSAAEKTVSAPFHGALLVLGALFIGGGIVVPRWLNIGEVKAKLDETQARLLQQKLSISIEVVLPREIELRDWRCYLLTGASREPVSCLTDLNQEFGETRKVKVKAYDVDPSQKLRVLLEKKGEALQSNEIMLSPLSIDLKPEGNETPISARDLGPKQAQ
jgi:hypothetical protein